jgi:stage V sporulation protein T
MKTGIIRRIDDLGRVVIPKEIRKSLRMNEGDPLEISIANNGVFLERYVPMYEFKAQAKPF